MTWITEHYSLVITALFGLSEVLALIPGVEANSVFQLVSNLIKQAHSSITSPKA